MATKFITDTQLKQETVVQKNIQPDTLTPFIDFSQALYVKRILGDSLYDSISATIDTYSLTGITGTTLAIINAMRPFLSYAILYTAVPYIFTKITNKGLVIKESEESTAASDEQMEKIRAEVYIALQFYQEEFKQWLRNHKSDYPDWREDIFYQKDYLSGATSSTRYFAGIEFDSDINIGMDYPPYGFYPNWKGFWDGNN